MRGTILDGKAKAQAVRQNVKAAVDELQDTHGVQPRLDAILAGDDAASELYVEKKQQDCKEVGIESRRHRYGSDIDQATLLDQITSLNEADSCDGILVQLPLPDPVDQSRVLEAVDPAKDVDGFHPVNLGRLVGDRPYLTPATPTGILHLLDAYDVELEGKNAVIVGRSTIVGKPMALLLLQRAVSATVTVCHSRTHALPQHTQDADLLISAVGRPEMITEDMVKPGATVIDVGINRTEDGLVGDVAFDTVRNTASQITPVPGGVGPLTRAMLLVNVVQAACRRQDLPVPDVLAESIPPGLRRDPRA